MMLLRHPIQWMMMRKFLLIFFIAEMANNAVLSLITRSIEEENGN